jgi:DHA2 family multidrug resistance protein-like MFS transporter
MFGLLFAVPLYFQVVHGTDAQGSGLRLLPLIGGMLVAGALADRLVARYGARVIAATGFALLAAGLTFGATTSVTSGDLQAVAWIALSGLGLGLVLPATIDTALSAVSDESSGVSSGVLQALRMVGSVLGAAILGAIINSTYRDQLEDAVSAPLASSARDSAVTGVEVANASGSQALLDAVRESFMSGMSLTLWVSAALMASGAVLALVLRPRPAATHVGRCRWLGSRAAGA